MRRLPGYKQLDDYRSGKRVWGVMSAIATALTAQDEMHAAAAYYGVKGAMRTSEK